MFRSPLFPIFLTVFVDVLALTLVLPLLPFYAEHFGASPIVVGTLSASFAVCQLVSGPILGRISDRAGRKPTLIASQLGTFAGFLMIGSASSLWMLFAGRIIDGLTAGNLSIAQAYISDVTKPENRTRAFGFIGIAFGTGFLVGPAVSGLLAKHYGYHAPAFGAAALSLASVIATISLLPDVKPTAGKQDLPGRGAFFWALFHRPGPRRRLLQFFAFTLSFSTLIGGLALFLERRFGYDVERTGYVYAFSGLIGASIQGGLIGRLAKRFGEERLSLVGFVAMASGYGLLGLAYSLPMLLATVVISAFGAAVARPSLTTLLTKSVGKDEQGGTLGASQSLSSIAQIVGPMTAGALIQHQLLGAYGATAAAFAGIGALLQYWSLRSTRDRAGEQPTPAS